ncbi:NADH oxidase, partial [Aliivibrio sifiae]
MTNTNIQLISTISEDNKLTLSLQDIDMPQPNADEVVIRIEAAPLNPSDLAVMFSAADMTTAAQSGSENKPAITADIPAQFMPAVKVRVGKA